MKKLDKFNVRVYGIIVHSGKILVSHERFRGEAFTKFPGGGVQLGEGVLDALVREFKEELNIEITPSFLFHVTESLQISTFYPEDQVIAIYYIVLCDEVDAIDTSKGKEEIGEKGEAFEWIELTKFNKDILSFESDREAASKLLDKKKV